MDHDPDWIQTSAGFWEPNDYGAARREAKKRDAQRAEAGNAGDRRKSTGAQNRAEAERLEARAARSAGLSNMWKAVNGGKHDKVSRHYRAQALGHLGNALVHKNFKAVDE